MWRCWFDGGTTIKGSFSLTSFASKHVESLDDTMHQRCSGRQCWQSFKLLRQWMTCLYSQNWPLGLRAGTIPWPKVARHHQGNSFQIITPVLFTKWNKPLTFASKTKTAWWDRIHLPLFILPCRNYLRVLFKHDLQEHPLQNYMWCTTESTSSAAGSLALRSKH